MVSFLEQNPKVHFVRIKCEIFCLFLRFCDKNVGLFAIDDFANVLIRRDFALILLEFQPS